MRKPKHERCEWQARCEKIAAIVEAVQSRAAVDTDPAMHPGEFALIQRIASGERDA